ncbi:MAG TPA: SBBP repeat-containing protein, partial [Cytophagales bacterium]
MKTTSTPIPPVATAVSPLILLRTGFPAILLLTLLAVLPVRVLHAQTFSWANRVSSSVTPLKVAADASGNSYVLGEFSGTVSLGDRTVTSSGGRDIFLVKYSPAGAVLWVRQMGGVSTDEAGGVAVAGDYVYITGGFRDRMYLPPSGLSTPSLVSRSGTDIFVARFAASTGTLVWANQGGGLLRDKGHGIAVDAAGNAYVTGEFYYDGTPAYFCNVPFCGGASTTLKSVYTNNKQMFVAKYNASGGLQWVTDGYSWGSYYPIYGKAIAVDPAGNIFVAGDFTYETIFDNYVRDANGNISYGYPHLAWLKDGSETHETNFSSVFIARYNPDNSIAWARQVGGVNREEATGIATIGSHVYLSGNSVSSSMIFKDG